MIVEAKRKGTVSKVPLMNKARAEDGLPGTLILKGLVFKKKKNPEKSQEILKGKKKTRREGYYRS